MKRVCVEGERRRSVKEVKMMDHKWRTNTDNVTTQQHHEPKRDIVPFHKGAVGFIYRIIFFFMHSSLTGVIIFVYVHNTYICM